VLTPVLSFLSSDPVSYHVSHLGHTSMCYQNNYTALLPMFVKVSQSGLEVTVASQLNIKQSKH